MEANSSTATLASRLESTLSDFLSAVPQAGRHSYVNELARLVAEVVHEKKLGRLDEKTSSVGAAVAAALQGMATIFLKTTQQGSEFAAQLETGQLRLYGCNPDGSDSFNPQMCNSGSFHFHQLKGSG